jgi:hypothetical protein
MRRRSLLTVALAALVLVAGCAGAGPSGATDDEPTEERSIAVAAAGSAAGSSDQAVVRLGVRATDRDAVDARRQLARNVTRMRGALREAGVEERQITTSRYDIYRDLERPRREGAEPRVRYRAAQSFEVTVDDAEAVGTVIDTAVRNGATEVGGVEFTLSAERRDRLDRTARRRAMASARDKADQLADAANLTVVGVRTVRTVDERGPRPVVEAAATPTATAGGADTDIESGPVTVTVRVEVVYEVEPTG